MWDEDFRAVADEIAQLEAIGLDDVFVEEGYSFDAVSRLGYLAARTTRVRLISGILPIYSRTPSLTAMTAAGLDFVSGRRFVLGLGTSGPQVIEGFHGVPYDAPVQRTREVIEICREVWRREPVSYAGKSYTLPLPADQGMGVGKPLKLINRPLRADIPISVASIGPRNVELTAEIANAWQPIFLYPDKVHEVWGENLAAGLAKRDAALGPLEIFTSVPTYIGDDAEEILDQERPHIALYVGGMGARGKNFYNELACRYGFEEAAAKIQELYLAGRKEEAAAAVPVELLRATTLIGSRGYVAERLAAYREAAVTTILAMPMVRSREGRRATIEGLLELEGEI
jgi:F420-dependent oxidoreductase-like protein